MSGFDFDSFMRHQGEIADQAVLDGQPRGIYSISSTFPFEPAPVPPAVTLEDLNRTMRQIHDAGLPLRPRLEFRYGEGVPEQLTTGIEMRTARPGEPNLDAIWGMPMVPDDSLAPGEWRIVDEFGAIRSLNNPALGVAVVLPTDNVWTMAPYDHFTRLEREGWGGADAGGILDRIDAVVEAWELGNDAYRYRPDDTPERGDLTK